MLAELCDGEHIIAGVVIHDIYMLHKDDYTPTAWLLLMPQAIGIYQDLYFITCTKLESG